MTDARTSELYDRWSASYDTHDNPMVGATEWALDRTPFECAGANVLELGCGTGRHVARVLEGGARSYVGVDGSPGMLGVARERHRDPRVRFVDGDVGARLPFDDGSFDRALIVLVLEHVSALDAPFAELGRLLVHDGRVRIVDIHPALVSAGTVAHFRDDGVEVQFESFAHPVAELRAALGRAQLTVTSLRELVAEGELLERVPKLAKHRGRPVLVDLEARR